MHEFSILQSLTERVEQEMRARDAIAVHSITLRIGELAGVEIDLLRSAWTLFRELPAWESTELVVEEEPARWQCSRCDAPVDAGAVLRCRQCGGPAQLESGGDILLQRMQLEVA